MNATTTTIRIDEDVEAHARMRDANQPTGEDAE
jgi:hypothetical protein